MNLIILGRGYTTALNLQRYFELFYWVGLIDPSAISLQELKDSMK